MLNNQKTTALIKIHPNNNNISDQQMDTPAASSFSMFSLPLSLACASATCLSLADKRQQTDTAGSCASADEQPPMVSGSSSSSSSSSCDSPDIAHTQRKPLPMRRRSSWGFSSSAICWFAMFALCVLCFAPAQSCGPGRGLGRRKERNLLPLVLKQRVPNMSEMHPGASGPMDGPIKRDSPKFKDLVPNYNKFILFRDEEGTGADRLMSKRCKEKLNTLAFSVANQWPSVRLLVTESWDEDNQHGEESLHYEGRAVTIATSDRDQTKYGMLARLAVEAGFDWVFYISRRHIYCSVKSDASTISHVHGCFTPESTALLESGVRKPLSELVIGDRVLSATADGQTIYSDIILFMDRNLEQLETFVELHTDGGSVLTVTPAHLVMVWKPYLEQLDYIFADSVQELDYLLVHDSTGTLRPQRVIRITTVRSKGVVAPLTKEGTIVVNSVAASCYAVIDSQKLAHFGMAPMRIWSKLQSWLPAKKQLRAEKAATGNVTVDARTTAQQQNGVHWYANLLYNIKDYVVPRSWCHK